MKLYFSPGACSMAVHILLNESGLPFQTEAVNLRTGQYSGGDYKKVNPKGLVPAIEIGNGTILTEAAVILQYISDLKPEGNFMPKAGTFERYRCMEWLNYIATELHKGFGPLWHDDTPEAFKTKTKENLNKQFDFLSTKINEAFLMGSQFTAPDAYLFTILNWTNFLKIDLSPWPVLKSYMSRVVERPAVQKTMKEENLKS